MTVLACPGGRGTMRAVKVCSYDATTLLSLSRETSAVVANGGEVVGVQLCRPEPGISVVPAAAQPVGLMLSPGLGRRGDP